MTDKPKIEVGQRWVTRGGNVVRVLSTSAVGLKSIVAQYEDTHEIFTWAPDGLVYDDETLSNTDLLHLAPSTVKREVALYEDADRIVTACEVGDQERGCVRISEPLTIEFTLLPGESA